MKCQLSADEISEGDRILYVQFLSEESPIFSEVLVEKITKRKIIGKVFCPNKAVYDFDLFKSDMGLIPYDDGLWNKGNFCVRDTDIENLKVAIKNHGKNARQKRLEHYDEDEYACWEYDEDDTIR